MFLYIRVYGIVQGVFYRASTKEVATKLGIKGYVKNMPDGSVEIVANVPKNLQKKFLNEIRFENDPLINVKKIEVREINENEWKKYNIKDEFEIRY